MGEIWPPLFLVLRPHLKKMQNCYHLMDIIFCPLYLIYDGRRLVLFMLVQIIHVAMQFLMHPLMLEFYHLNRYVLFGIANWVNEK